MGLKLSLLGNLAVSDSNEVLVYFVTLLKSKFKSYFSLLLRHNSPGADFLRIVK